MSEKRTQNKGTKKSTRDTELQKEREKASIGCGSGFLCFWLLE